MTFGGVAATSFTVVSDSQIRAVAPAGTAGTVDIIVTTPYGVSTAVAGDEFTYDLTPAITGVVPPSGSPTGGTAVTITGTGLTGATAVTFGTSAAASFTDVSSAEVIAVSPAHATGTVNLVVTTPGGKTATVAADQFTFGTPPTIMSISPPAGPPSGGTVVTIVGTGFTGTVHVAFGAVAATSVTRLSNTQLHAVSPPKAAATVGVSVTTAAGTSPTTGADAFTYAPVPTVTGVSPTTGSTKGGTSVTITGTGFTGATKVAFGTTSAAHFVVVSSTKITTTLSRSCQGSGQHRRHCTGRQECSRRSQQVHVFNQGLVFRATPA